MLDMYRRAMRIPELTKEIGVKGLMTWHGDIALFHSGSFMNDSGVAVATALRAFRRRHPTGVLCVIHDELESSLGTIKLRYSGKGKGHNGIRSCLKHLGAEDFARMAIGISRPDSRESDVVTRWVLGKFSSPEVRVLEERSLVEMVRLVGRLQLEAA